MQQRYIIPIIVIIANIFLAFRRPRGYGFTFVCRICRVLAAGVYAAFVYSQADSLFMDTKPLSYSDYLIRILTASVYDVAVETPLEPARILSRRLNNNILLKR